MVQLAKMRRKAIIAALIGATLGCLTGAMLEVRQTGSTDVGQPYVLSVNQRTGKPQLHVQGKPELK